MLQKTKSLSKFNSPKYLEALLITITSYYFFAISEGSVFYFNWTRIDLINALFTLWMVVSSWVLFKRLNRVLGKKKLGSFVLPAVLQAIISIIFLGAYTLLSNWLYIEVLWEEHLGNTLFFNLVFPMALITFTIWNIGFYIFNSYKNLLRAQENKTEEALKQLIIKIGKKNIVVPIDNIAYFKTHERHVYACTYNAQKYLVDNYLNALEQQLDGQQFFRLNRQMLIAKQAVLNYQTDENQKLKVFFMQVNGFEDTAIVSRYKAPEFKAWLKT
ncbi:MAG: LytTR family DNA-binding domain-containing protein [Bacteroidota bacterium]